MSTEGSIDAMDETSTKRHETMSEADRHRTVQVASELTSKMDNQANSSPSKTAVVTNAPTTHPETEPLQASGVDTNSPSHMREEEHDGSEEEDESIVLFTSSSEERDKGSQEMATIEESGHNESSIVYSR